MNERAVHPLGRNDTIGGSSTNVDPVKPSHDQAVTYDIECTDINYTVDSHIRYTPRLPLPQNKVQGLSSIACVGECENR